MLGAVLYVRHDRMGELPENAVGPRRGRVGRLCLGASLCGTALLAPAYQMHLHTEISLPKHIGYGLLFAAPMAGVGMSRLVGAHFRRPELGILVWVTLLILGVTQSQDRYSVWPDSSRLIAALAPRLSPGGHYLVGANWVPQYYLRARTSPNQWTSTYTIGYTDRRGERLTGETGYRAAIQDGYFDLIVLDPAARTIDKTLARQLRATPSYRLLATLPYRNSSGGAFYRITYGDGAYQVWVRASLQPTRPR